MITLTLREAAATVSGDFSGSDGTFLGVSTDSRQVQSGQLYVALRGDRFDGHDFVDAAMEAGAAGAIVERPSKLTHQTIQVDDSRLALGQLATAWHARFPAPVAAVTGSNGKTTVKEMLLSILSRIGPTLATRGNLNNNIGVPLTLFRQAAHDRYAIIEMGANHGGEIAELCALARPDVAIITQCAPAHLEGFGSVAGVAHAKGEILSGLKPDGTAVINADDAFAELWKSLAAPRRCLTFGLQAQQADITATYEPDAEHWGGHRVRVRGATLDGLEFTLSLPGRHNVMNALGTVAMCVALGVDAQTIAAGLTAMQPVQGRMQFKQGLNGARIFDDTYNANPGSLKAALEVLAACPGERWLLLGDMAELGKDAAEFHIKAGIMARELNVDRLYATGELTRHTVSAYGQKGKHFTSTTALAASLGSALNNNVTVLVKGSRSMHMETVVKALLADGK